MTVFLRLQVFYSQGDESRLFAALEAFAAVCKIRGVGRGIDVKLDIRRLSRESLRDLIALLYRYRIPLRPLGVLADRRRFAWLNDPLKYWHRSMFGAGRKRSATRP